MKFTLSWLKEHLETVGLENVTINERKGVGEVIAPHHARKPLEETVGACAAECFRPSSPTILDATAFFALTDALKLRAGIFNLTDEKYAYWQDVRGLAATSSIIDAYTQPGRNASASLSFQF